MPTRPSVNIIFAQRASTLITRSGEECVILLVDSATATSKPNTFIEANYLSEVPKATLDGLCGTGESATDKDVVYRAVQYCFGNCPRKVIISNMGYSSTLKECIGRGITTGIITGISADSGFDTTAVTEVMSLNSAKDYGFTALLCGNEPPTVHNIHYVHIAGSSYVNYYGSLAEGALSSYEVQALYAGAIACCGVDRSLTNYTLPLIKNVAVQANSADYDFVGNGFIHAEMLGDKPRVVSGVNTAEVSDSITEDMQHIEVILTMDMIRKDITDTFAEYYRGAYKNNYANQILLIAAINGYFTDLGEEDVLDPEYDNLCTIDVEEQRQAWKNKGRTEADSWSEDKVKLMSFGRKVFLAADIKVCQSMEDLRMYINLE